MAKGYWIARVDIKDEEPAKRYADCAMAGCSGSTADKNDSGGACARASSIVKLNCCARWAPATQKCPLVGTESTVTVLAVAMNGQRDTSAAADCARARQIAQRGVPGATAPYAMLQLQGSNRHPQLVKQSGGPREFGSAAAGS